MTSLGDQSRDREGASVLEILDLVAHQCALSEILAAICRLPDGWPVACFLTDGDRWSLAATSHPESTAWSAITPNTISEAIFHTTPGTGCLGSDSEGCTEKRLDTSVETAGRSACATFAGGWARHLCSESGELLCLMIGLAGGPALPWGPQARRVESACRLAILAIEQRHLLDELAFRTAQYSRSLLARRRNENEVSMQQIAQMIADQSPPEAILGAMCRHLRRGESEFQMAFFLADGDRWRLAAKGELSRDQEAALAQIDPVRLSESLFQQEQNGAGRFECPFDHGWARHLFSGTGELLGLLVGIGSGPGVPLGAQAMRVESICRLATLAIEQRNMLEELAFKANHDALTKLPNRSFYERLLAQTLNQATGSQRSTALLYINLDRFRQVNEVMGIAIGNRLLAQVGHRFESCLRETDLLARVGGDEFAVVLPNRASIENAGTVAGRLLRSLSKPFTLDDHELYLSASIGIGYATAGSTAQSLEREAYVALYQAKQAGKAQSMAYRQSMAATPPERLEMEKRLRSALANREMRLYYQPQLELATGVVRGAEALLRWRPEGLGMVSPGAFVPILEETGMIADFGRWVLNEACRQGKEWIDQYGLHLRVGVNVSALQFARADFDQDVEQALADTGFPPQLLELELTESLIISNFAATQRTFRKLQAAGIGFALDDFGIGQSSLSYLHELPFQRLKIDQAFIRRIADDETQAPIVESVVRMAEGLGISTIAEGVETVHQAELLRQLCCQEGQGFLFSHALPPGDFMTFYRSRSPASFAFDDTAALTAVSELISPMSG